jgi:hypothetical protein
VILIKANSGMQQWNKDTPRDKHGERRFDPGDSNCMWTRCGNALVFTLIDLGWIEAS